VCYGYGQVKPRDNMQYWVLGFTKHLFINDNFAESAAIAGLYAPLMLG